MNLSITNILLGLAALAISTPTPNSIETIQKRNDGKKCPVGDTLPSNYVAPSLMVPVSKKHPNARFGPTQFPTVTPGDICTIFNLVLPPEATNATCHLEFLLPTIEQSLSPEVFAGPGHFTFTGYAVGAAATPDTTFAHQPEKGPDPPNPPPVMTPGHAYTINTAPCGLPPGVPEPGVTVSGMLCSDDTWLSYVQSTTHCPLGFFVALEPLTS